MSRGLMCRPPGRLRPGWWCEFIARTPRADGEATRTRAREAASAEQALVWMRVSVRELISGFDAEDNARAYRWLDHGQWEAVMRLKAGDAYAFVARIGATRLEWTARPVLLLPRALHAGPPGRCAEPARCVCVAPGHGSGRG